MTNDEMMNIYLMSSYRDGSLPSPSKREKNFFFLYHIKIKF